MSWVMGQKLVCIICLQRFEVDKNGKDSSSEKPVQVHNSGSKDSPILVVNLADEDEQEEKLCGESERTDTDLYKRFLVFVSQHFKLKDLTDRLITCAKNAKSDDGAGAKLETFCEGCVELVREICNLHKEIETAKLLLAWKLSLIGQLIKKAKVPMSNKLTKELKMSMKKQMNLDAVRPVDIFRASLQINCIKAATAGLPNVIMHRGLFPDEWKFTYSATKEALIRLIAIFIIGSTRYATYHRNDANVQNNLKNSGNQRPCPKSKKRADTENHFNDCKLTAMVKNEPESIETEEAIANVDDDDANGFGGSDHDANISEPENAGNDSDSDWSRGGAASPMIAGSDIPSDSTEPETEITSRKLRWNLRGRRNLIVMADEDEEETDTEESYKATTRRKRKLYIAKSNDDSNPGFKCPQCPKLCKDLRGLSVHLFWVHRSVVQHNCKKCGMRFKRALDLQLHHKNVHAKYNSKGRPIRGRAPIQSTCPKCGQVFPTRTDLYLHHKNVHILRRITRPRQKRWIPEGKFICKICGARCVDSIELAAHRQSHGDDDDNQSIKNDAKKISKNKRSESSKVAKLFSERKVMNKLLDPASPPPPGKVFKEGRPRFKPVTISPKKDKIMQKKFTKLSCDVENCGETLKTPYLLRKHLENEHEAKKSETEKNIQCNHCYKRFCYPQSQEIHVRAEHKSKIYGDFKCDWENCTAEAFISVEELNGHLKIHLEKEPQDELGEGFKEILFCGKCNWGFLREEIRDLHELVHIVPDKLGNYPCPKCNSTYTTHFLKFHYNREHGSNLRQYKCDECDNSYFTKVRLNQHKTLHDRRRNMDPEVKLVCIQCGIYVKDYVLLEAHMRQHQPPSDRYKCLEPFCGQKFCTNFRLKCHIKKAHGTRDFVCKECGQAFFFKNHLNNHYKTHNKDGGFPCDECGKVFKTLVLVTRHKKTVHLKDRKLSEVCSLCGKSFYTNEGLRYHFDSHHKPESEWHLKCPTCPRRFYRSAFLRIHEKKCDGSGARPVVVNKNQKKDEGESKTVERNEIKHESSTITEGGRSQVKPSSSLQQTLDMHSSFVQQPTCVSQQSGIPSFPQMQLHQPFMTPFMEPPPSQP